MREQTAALLRTSLDEGEQVCVRVSGHCMAPRINDGALITVTNKLPYRAGDAIVFLDHEHQGFIVHRLLGTLRYQHNLLYMTKADSRSTPDALLRPEQVVGKVDGFVPTRAEVWRCKAQFLTFVVKFALRKIVYGKAAG